MPLPEVIEILPHPPAARSLVVVPGSKSITNRALVLAALAEGEITLRGALWSEDTQVMVECLQEMGFMVNVAPDPQEACNRTLTVYGLGGRVPRGGTPDRPLDLFVGNAGTAARFLAALVCLGQGVYRLHGAPRMHQRPQGALFDALRSLGYQIEAPDNHLPALVHGGGPRPGRCRVSLEESSQFASALILSARDGQWQVELAGTNSEESPYVQMTSSLCASFPRQGGEFVIEPDASSSSYFWAAWHLLAPDASGQVARWPNSGWQIDADFPRYLPLPGTLSRQAQLGDSIMTAIVLAPLADHPVLFTHLGRLRLQECERVMALRTELTRCGARVIEHGDNLEVHPSPLHGAEIETYGDHRMAMCFAVLGLKIPGLRIKDPACVRKTFPNFFQKLAAPSPAGLGAEIREGGTGRRLRLDELSAE